MPWKRATVRRKVLRLADEIISSPKYSIFDFDTENDQSHFYCRICGYRQYGNATIHVYIWTICAYLDVDYDTICDDCHNMVQENIYDKTIGKQVREYKKNLKKLKTELKKAKRLGL
jgi:hypothetical protein